MAKTSGCTWLVGLCLLAAVVVHGRPPASQRIIPHADVAVDIEVAGPANTDADLVIEKLQSAMIVLADTYFMQPRNPILTLPEGDYQFHIGIPGWVLELYGNTDGIRRPIKIFESFAITYALLDWAIQWRGVGYVPPVKLSGSWDPLLGPMRRSRFRGSFGPVDGLNNVSSTANQTLEQALLQANASTEAEVFSGLNVTSATAVKLEPAAISTYATSKSRRRLRRDDGTSNDVPTEPWLGQQFLQFVPTFRDFSLPQVPVTDMVDLAVDCNARLLLQFAWPPGKQRMSAISHPGDRRLFTCEREELQSRRSIVLRSLPGAWVAWAEVHSTSRAAATFYKAWAERRWAPSANIYVNWTGPPSNLIGRGHIGNPTRAGLEGMLSSNDTYSLPA